MASQNLRQPLNEEKPISHAAEGNTLQITYQTKCPLIKF